MKKLFALIYSLLIIMITVGHDNAEKYPYEVSFTELSIPLSGYYTEGTFSRCALDIEICDDRLYVGSGDYDKNAGPVNIFYYDIKNKKWVNDGLLEDEEISRFYIFNGKLTAAGIDPKAAWDYGNFYVRQKNGWQTYTNIPGAIHNFDMAQFDGKLFAGLGVKAGEFPAAVSSDNGKSWQQVPFYRNGTLLDKEINATVRVYDLFTHKNKLYAHYRIYDGEKGISQIYVYENGSFNYYSSLFDNAEFERTSYHFINQKLEFNEKQFIAAGNLYVSEDMKTAKEIELMANAEVVDLKLLNDKLYLLCNEEKEKPDGTKYFTISVWCTKTGGSGDFHEVFFFDYEVRALSFAYNDCVFYFGMGYGKDSGDTLYDKNGMILSVVCKV